MADIVRYAGQGFIERSRRWINGQHEKVLLAIMRCRTAALGGHRDRCSGCGHSAISYNSCRNRHCPRCQGNARIRWLEQRATMPDRCLSHCRLFADKECSTTAVEAASFFSAFVDSTFIPYFCPSTQTRFRYSVLPYLWNVTSE
jgi:hypothetical protein